MTQLSCILGIMLLTKGVIVIIIVCILFEKLTKLFVKIR